MTSQIEQLCAALVAAARPIDALARELNGRAVRLRAAAQQAEGALRAAVGVDGTASVRAMDHAADATTRAAASLAYASKQGLAYAARTASGGQASSEDGIGEPVPDVASLVPASLPVAPQLVVAPIPGAPGHHEVNLSVIDTSDRAIGPQDFMKGYSPEDLAWAYAALHEVILPALAESMRADYFRERDVAEGLVGTRSYTDTYSGFLGDESIRVEKQGDRFVVTNGYHRIWVARQLGLSRVPAKVVE